MVVNFTRFITSTPTTTDKHRPILNSIPMTNLTHASRLGSFNQQYNNFWKRFQSSPEMYGIINILVTDIIGDRPEFTDTKGMPLGRNKRYEAERLWRSNRIKETLKAVLFDMFVTGDGYGWKAYPSDNEKIKAVKEAMQKYTLKLKQSDFTRVFIKAVQDEDLKLPKRFDYIASSTVHINSDNYDVQGYTQVCMGKTVEFTPEEVIHFRLNTMNGMVEGYTPMQSLVKDLALLYFVKGNMLAYMENGGRPELLYTMKNAQPGSDSFNDFQQQLQQFKQVENRHGALLGTGDVDVSDLTFGKQKDMEYQNLALWTLSGMLFTYGIPISRVPFLIGKAATGGDSGGMAESGYQSMISERQDMIEDIMNYQFFDKYGFHIKLPRHYKQDKIREAQAFSMNTAAVIQLQSVYRTMDKKVSINKLNEILNVSADDLEEIPEEEKMMNIMDPGLRNQNLLDKNSTDKEPDNQKRADTKKNVANDKENKGLAV